MIWPLPLIAIILGIVEGITEFLPISSTGHLLLTNHLLGFEGDRAEAFAIFIQLGAILAIVVEYRKRLISDVARKPGFAVNLGVAFLPAAVIGLLTHHWIKEHLFGPKTVAAALIVGAIAIALVERFRPTAVVARAEEAGVGRSFLIGVAQCFSLWPGFSRSAATILGGLLCGLERQAATEFSFFLAIPTMGAATVWDLYKNRQALDSHDFVWLFVSTAIAFLVAWAAIRWFLRFVSRHSLTPFAWYRIALGLLVLALVR
ncbi:MAG TPA: undecaprenyl-diphosphate phosphatase [Candidatus Polarisedimenticolaceae bacterium]|nr:undecaprenyl-diphosphate phosphatase [Candidatus Polarisedimenticolaceae bacterium]